MAADKEIRVSNLQQESARRKESRFQLRSEPITQMTRDVRRSMLIASGISIVMIRTGIIPNKLTVLGLDFGNVNIDTLLAILAIIQTYFLVSFIVYLLNDLAVWRLEEDASQQFIDTLSKDREELKEFLDSLYFEHVVYSGDRGGGKDDFFRPIFDADTIIGIWQASRPYSGSVGFIRRLVDYILPILFSVYGVVISVIQLLY